MKRIILEAEPNLKHIKDVQHRKCYIYVANNHKIWILAKLGYAYVKNDFGMYHYGFVPLGDLSSKPVFTATSIEDSIAKAIRSSKNVLEFNNLSEAMKWKFKIDPDDVYDTLASEIGLSETAVPNEWQDERGVKYTLTKYGFKSKE